MTVYVVFFTLSLHLALFSLINKRALNVFSNPATMDCFAPPVHLECDYLGCRTGDFETDQVPMLKTRYPQLESYSKRSDVQFCVKECARGVQDRMQRAVRICRDFLCSSLFSAIVEIKSLLVAIWLSGLIVILIQSTRTPTHSGSRKPPFGKF